MVTNTSGRAPSARQRKEINAARGFLGNAIYLRAYAVGRANARWTDGATALATGFGGVFFVALVVFHVILFPGVIVLYALYGLIKPRRGVAVTSTGVTELALSMWNGRPSSVIETTDHAALFVSQTTTSNGVVNVPLGREVVSLRSGDLSMLRASVATDPLTPGHGTLDFPAPPGDKVGQRARADKPLPRWREVTLLWIISHLGISLILFLGVIIGAFAVASGLGRDTTNPQPNGALMWLSFLLTAASWLSFVFYRGSRRVRYVLLAGLLGGGLVIGSVAIVLGSPLTQH